MQERSPYKRYSRQMLLPGVGESGQDKLSLAKVLVVGAGGLGCPVLQYLSGAGIGTIGIVDDDLVSISNLHRQVLYNMADIGTVKSVTAAKALSQLNPDIQLTPYPERLTNQNALTIIQDYDLVVDGSDNFATRYLVNDACVLLNKPLVYGAISTFEGQVAVFNVPGNNAERGVNYRDLFPDPPAPDEVRNCAEAGVLGILPGVVGSLMAGEVLKLVLGIGNLLTGKLLTYNSLTNAFDNFLLTASAISQTESVPIDVEGYLEHEYGWNCAGGSVPEITFDEVLQLLSGGSTSVVDVREPGELPLVFGFEHIRYPLSKLRSHIPELPDTIITFCKSGQRSKEAADLLRSFYGNAKKVYSLKGGVGSIRTAT